MAEILGQMMKSITVTSPNGSETWTLGGTRAITWSSTGVTANVKLVLFKDGIKTGNIATDLPVSGGTYNWTVGAYVGGTVVAGTGYTVRIITMDGAYSDYCDAPFAIESTANLTLTSPNGSETWPLGCPRLITWTATGISANVKLVLFQNGVKKGNIISDIPIAKGYYRWTVGNYIGGTSGAGTGFTVRVITLDGTYRDDSDASFAITPLNLVSPNGYENWQTGSTHPITWTAPGISSLVKLVLFKDGVKLGNIAINLSAGSGAFSWPVGTYIGGTAAVGTGYAVRLITIDGALQDNSDATFSITAASPMNLTSPNGGEKWQISTSQPITWTAGGVTGNVKLVLFKNGVKIGNIVSDIPASAETYAWTAGNYQGGTASDDVGYSVRIITMDGSNKDESDGPFELLSTTSPVGGIDTPDDGTTGITGVLPISGWAVDDEEVTRVEIRRKPVENESESVLLGEAIWLENARPQIESQYPDYAKRDRAGWGYALATHNLPNQGNGTFTLQAIAYDNEGNKTVLGEKDITCSNANAVQPFGEILTPTQGETLTSNGCITTGWALTPLPKGIPQDGSTLAVYVDGVKIGQPSFGRYHDGVARMFPTLANSQGAEGDFTLDTSKYADGTHLLGWSAMDNFGMTASTGLTYFRIENGTRSMTPTITMETLAGMPLSLRPVRVKKGYRTETIGELAYPGGDGAMVVEMEEIDRIVIELTEQANEKDNARYIRQNAHPYAGYLKVGEEFRPLPVGSNIDPEKGIFFWQAGAGFIGQYELAFTDGSTWTRIIVNIKPKRFIQ